MNDTLTISKEELNYVIEILASIRDGKPVPRKPLCSTVNESNLRYQIREVLISLGVRTNVLGYTYLISAIQKVYYDPITYREITSCLYPAISKEHNTSPARVERAIRHAIEIGVDESCSMDSFKTVFGNSIAYNRGKPTNAHFISGVADYIHSLNEINT
jgi:two-component system response regulator (stage 0 sporulation protein A)